MARPVFPQRIAASLTLAFVRRELADSPEQAGEILLELAAGLAFKAADVRRATSCQPVSNVHDLRGIGEEYARVAYRDTHSRRLDGVFYTPTAVIDRILDLADSALVPGATVCDPAMGCGFFFLCMLERLNESGASPDAVREWAGSSLHGVDRDPGAVLMTRALLCLALSRPGDLFLPDPARLRVGDSLLGPAFGEKGRGKGLGWAAAFPQAAEAGGFDVVMGNPPYEVLTNFTRHPERKTLAAELRRCGWYELALEGQINLYRCFIERSLHLLKPGGVVSLVVPLSLTRDGSASRLRRHLLTECGAEEWRLYREDDRLFAGATQSACVFRAVRGAGQAGTVRIAAGEGETALPFAELAGLSDADSLVLPAASGREMERMRWLRRNCRGRLDELAECRVGEVDQTVYRECMSDTDTGCLLARGGHLRPFWLDVSPGEAKARFLDLPLFLRRKGRMAEECVRRASLRRVVQLGIRNMQSLPRLVAATAPPGVYLGNSLNVYFPRAGVSVEYLAGLLNSRLLDWLFRFGSGNNNINLKEMAGLPFPDRPGEDRMRKVAEAYRSGVRAAEAGKDLAAARRRLDSAVEACYGLPESLSV